MRTRPDYTDMKFLDPDAAFNEAINSGRLGGLPADPKYAGNYMYMGHRAGVATFKHIQTRKYLS